MGCGIVEFGEKRNFEITGVMCKRIREGLKRYMRGMEVIDVKFCD